MYVSSSYGRQMDEFNFVYSLILYCTGVPMVVTGLKLFVNGPGPGKDDLYDNILRF